MIWAYLISSHIIATDMAPEAGQLAMWPWASNFISHNVNILPNLLSVQLHHEIKSYHLFYCGGDILQAYWNNLLGYVGGLPFQFLSYTRNIKLWKELTASFYMRERSNNVTANCSCNSFFHINYLCCTSKFSKTLGYQPNKCHFSKLLLPGASFNLHRQLFSCLKFYCKFCIHKPCSPCLYCLPSYDFSPPLGC